MLAKLRTLDFGGRFTPPSLKGTVVFPGFSSGAEWGGQAYDPETHIFYINADDAVDPAPGPAKRDEASH